jgi:hypothetical protein
MKTFAIALLATLSFATASFASNAGMATRDLACTHGTITPHGFFDCR